MELSLERKLYFAAVGTKVNAQFFESIRTRKNVRTFIYGECDYSDKDITKLEFVQYKELPSENNGYKSIDEDYFVSMS